MTDDDELFAEVDRWLEDTPPLVQAGTVRMVERLRAAALRAQSLEPAAATSATPTGDNHG